MILRGRWEFTMTNEEYRKIVSRNLKRIAYDNHKSQADIVRDLNLKQPTVSSWMNGTRMVQMKDIDLLCHYFNCKRADLMEEHQTNTENTYIEEANGVIATLNEENIKKAISYMNKLLALQKAEDELK